MLLSIWESWSVVQTFTESHPDMICCDLHWMVKWYFKGEIIFPCIHIICFIKLQQLTHNCWICINAGMQVMKVSDNLIHEQPCSPGEMNNMQIHHSSCPPFLYDDISKSIQYQNSDLNHVVAVPLHSSITYSDGIALFVFGIRTPLHPL